MSKSKVLTLLPAAMGLTLLGLSFGLQVWNSAIDVKEDGWKAIFFPVEFRGPIGMNDGARLAFCRAVDSIVQARTGDGVHLRCTGKHVNIAVLSLDDGRPIAYGRVSVDTIPDGMRREYQVLLADFKALPLYGDRATGRTDAPVPVSEVAGKAERLGVKTVGDFWAACGFHRYCQR